MYRPLLTLLFISCVSVSFAQTKPVAKPAAKQAVPAAAKQATPTPAKQSVPAAAKPVVALKNAADSMSYAIGVLDANFFKTQGLDSINSKALASGFSDQMKGQTLFTPEQADQIVRSAMQKMARVKIQPAIDQCNNFLAENAKKPGVKQTASGLQYEVIQEGSGAKPAVTDTVSVHYEGFLLDRTTPFDSSRDRGEPTSFPLNRVIKGWTEGVQLMSVGSKYKFYIPYQLAYGEQGSPPTIPGGSLLIFEVELIDIKK
ncbi:MAG: FKBP-type peptidyl-prolyl cis-trans isomerase [bacterium]|jgi:FKBP-type peptidyl-prolyl cis-trans isomerase